jgi:carbonic anhydrase
MQKIRQGLVRFQKEIFPSRRELFERLAHKQTPQALFITCSDSRIVPDMLMQTEPGDLFICRNAGNIVPPYGETTGGVSATIEYAIMALGIRNIILCGHSNCGAMKGVMHPESLTEMPTVASWLRHADAARRVVQKTMPDVAEEDKLSKLTEQNVVAQIRNLMTHPSVISHLMSGDLNLYGWVYDIHNGTVRGYDGATNRFVTIDGVHMPVAQPQNLALPVAV